MDISILSSAPELVAEGQSHQILAQLEVKNTGEAVEQLGGSLEEIATQLGVSIEGGPEGMPTTLSYLFIDESEKHKQFDLEGKSVEVAPGDDFIVELRLVEQPGGTGTLTLHVKDVAKEIPIA